MNKNFALSSCPKTLDNFICTKAHKIIFSNIIESKDFSSFIFFGSPGTGKSTIAYILANRGVDVIDCGVPVLSMHSPYELTSKYDIYTAYRGYLAFFNN